MSKVDKAIEILEGSTEGPLTPIQKLINEYDRNHFSKNSIKEVLNQISSALEVLTGPEDIYEINTPFAMLDVETQKALADNGDLEYFWHNKWWPLKCAPDGPVSHLTIRAVKPIKASINWDHVDDKFKWLAMDEDGVYFLYAEKPEFDGEVWKAVWVDCIESTGFKSFVPGTCAAKDSLVERPKNEV